MKKNVILITGANRGIGLEAARQLSRLGNEVILTARDIDKGKKVVDILASEGLKIHFLRLDVTDSQQISKSVEDVKDKFGSLDVLINNAGIMMKNDRSLLDANESVLQKTMAVNAFAPLKITQAFVSIMPNGGRVIMVSSSGGSMTDPVGGWSPAYCASKSLLNAITRHLAFELAGKGIFVNAMCPGWVRTDLGGPSAPLTVEQGADTAVWLATTDMKETGKSWKNRKNIPW